MVRGSYTAFHMSWRSSYANEKTAIAIMEAEMRQKHEGYLRIPNSGLEQTIILTPRARGFGGHQCYFMCPFEDRCCSVLWRPPSTVEFSLPTGMGQTCVAYASQLKKTPFNSAHRQWIEKWNLDIIRDQDADEWDLPPRT